MTLFDIVQELNRIFDHMLPKTHVFMRYGHLNLEVNIEYLAQWRVIYLFLQFKTLPPVSCYESFWWLWVPYMFMFLILRDKPSHTCSVEIYSKPYEHALTIVGTFAYLHIEIWYPQTLTLNSYVMLNRTPKTHQLTIWYMES